MFTSLIASAALILLPQAGSSVRVAAASKTEAARLVRFTMVNMSGTAREVRIRETVIVLPVGQRVTVQAWAGEKVTIISSTDTKVRREMVVTQSDDGRVLPVQ